MTDRIYSCKHSPNGRHRFTVSPLMCDYCARTTTYLVDMGWNAPAVDPDAHPHATMEECMKLAASLWEDQEADVNDVKPTPRRAYYGETECPAWGPWSCERQAGHSGRHMAWESYPDTLYPGGAWD